MLPTSFKEAIIEMMTQIAKEIPDVHKNIPVKAYLTGGGAVHYYCNSRVSDDYNAPICQDNFFTNHLSDTSSLFS